MLIDITLVLSATITILTILRIPITIPWVWGGKNATNFLCFIFIDPDCQYYKAVWYSELYELKTRNLWKRLTDKEYNQRLDATGKMVKIYAACKLYDVSEYFDNLVQQEAYNLQHHYKQFEGVIEDHIRAMMISVSDDAETWMNSHVKD